MVELVLLPLRYLTSAIEFMTVQLDVLQLSSSVHFKGSFSVSSSNNYESK